MKRIFKTNVYSKRLFILIYSSLIVLVHCFPSTSSSDPFIPLSIGDGRTFTFSTSEEKSNVNVTFMRQEAEYLVSNQYDFFVPHVAVNCQCMCTKRKESHCERGFKCGQLNNSNSTCAMHFITANDSSHCSDLYKLCCQVYFTKTEDVKPFKALYLKYRQTFLAFNVVSKSFDTLTVYNITLTESVKHLLVGPDKVVHISPFTPLRPIRENWYFIEEGCNELQYSETINEADEMDLNKLGWFKYSGMKKELSRLTIGDLRKHLEVTILDCNSVPFKYEWKLNATHYMTNGHLNIPKNVRKASELMDIKISKSIMNLEDKEIKVELNNPPSVHVMLTDVTSYPFLFTSSIKERNLNLTFTKGNGTFAVEITSPHWSTTISFITSSVKNIIQLPSLNYDSCWVCVYRESQQLCQIPNLVKYSQIFGKSDDDRKNLTMFQTRSMTENLPYTDVPLIATIIILGCIVIWLLIVIRQQRKPRNTIEYLFQPKPSTAEKEGFHLISSSSDR